MEYFPFGETFIEERTDAEYTSYLYNGKELDKETGLYYYGARYYDPRISMLYGVDPLAEKYSFQSPFCYAGNNPIKFIDAFGLGSKNPNDDSPSFLSFLWNMIMKELGMEPSYFDKSSAYFMYESDDLAYYRFLVDTYGGPDDEGNQFMSDIDPLWNKDLSSLYLDHNYGNITSTEEISLTGNAGIGATLTTGVANDSKGYHKRYISLGGGFSPGLGGSLSVSKTSYYHQQFSFTEGFTLHDNLSFNDLIGPTVDASASFFGFYRGAGFSTNYGETNSYLYYSKGISANFNLDPFMLSTGFSYSFGASCTWMIGDAYSNNWENYSIKEK